MTTTLLKQVKDRSGQTVDPRLRPIWVELMRRRRKDARFLHPTTFDAGLGTAEERQQFAICMLLSMACDLAERPRPIMTRRDLEKMRADLQGTAKALRKTVATAVRLGLRAPHVLGDQPQPDLPIEAADEFESMAANLCPIVIERDRGTSREQAVAISLAEFAYLFFGKSMPGVVATLASVVLGEKVTSRQVKQWWQVRRAGIIAGG
jgi:hypothetical protein